MATLHIPLFLFRLRVWLMVQIVFLGDGTAQSSRGSVRWTFASQRRGRYRLAGKSIVVSWCRSVWLGSRGRFDIALVSVRTRTPKWQLSPSLLGMISSSGMLPACISGVRVHPDGMLFFISKMTFWSWVGWNSAGDSLSMAADRCWVGSTPVVATRLQGRRIGRLCLFCLLFPSPTPSHGRIVNCVPGAREFFV